MLDLNARVIVLLQQEKDARFASDENPNWIAICSRNI
jgi:hypothetical protein